jgi:hypothetical protein
VDKSDGALAGSAIAAQGTFASNEREVSEIARKCAIPYRMAPEAVALDVGMGAICAYSYGLRKLTYTTRARGIP